MRWEATIGFLNKGVTLSGINFKIRDTLAAY